MIHILSPESWVKNHADYLYSIAVFKTSDHEVAQDLVQDTFLSALHNIDGFKGEASERTWLTRILNNKIIDFYRKKRNENSDIDSYLASTETDFETAVFGENEHGRWTNRILPWQASNSTDMYMEQLEFQTALDGCLQHLPQKLRRIFIEKYLEDKSPENICTENDISNSNYWVIIHRAKVLLRNCLESKAINVMQ